MTYKILSTRQVEITLFTTVEYNFDGLLHIVEIPHFMPESQEAIEQNIINGAESELARLQSVENIQNIIAVLPINEEKPIG
jgi:hypothetical protein